jgi:hypothetical protein
MNRSPSACTALESACCRLVVDRLDPWASTNCLHQLSRSWCSALWCYVDPAQCHRPLGVATFFANAVFSNHSLQINATYTAPRHSHSLSYATCGYVNPRSQLYHGSVSTLQGFAASEGREKLRVGLPGDSTSGFTLVGSIPYLDGAPKVIPYSGVGGTNRSGSIPVLMDNMFTRYGVAWEEVAISARSLEYSPTSSWTACVHDVAIGRLDMCERH